MKSVLSLKSSNQNKNQNIPNNTNRNNNNHNQPINNQQKPEIPKKNDSFDEENLMTQSISNLTDGQVLAKREFEMKQMERMAELEEEKEKKEKEKMEKYQKEAEEIAKALPKEPSQDDPGSCVIVFRLPRIMWK